MSAAKLDRVVTTERAGMIEKSGRPAYLQIADQLREQIQSGSLAPDAPLPSTAQLGTEYGVSASVVKAAVSVLRAEGLVVGQQGKGVFVRSDSSGAGSDDGMDDALTAQLHEIRTALRVLSERMTELEAAVFPGRKRTQLRGK
jgi:DNA-binding GntR family transcriptional regulator